jgi:hypothetical protein
MHFTDIFKPRSLTEVVMYFMVPGSNLGRVTYYSGPEIVVAFLSFTKIIPT